MLCPFDWLCSFVTFAYLKQFYKLYTFKLNNLLYLSVSDHLIVFFSKAAGYIKR